MHRTNRGYKTEQFALTFFFIKKEADLLVKQKAAVTG